MIGDDSDKQDKDDDVFEVVFFVVSFSEIESVKERIMKIVRQD